MTLRTATRKAFSPPAEVSKFDTGLRFTDVLFGFVIKELFIRLQDWGELPGFVRLQLVVGTALVLGSWIGFRRSLNRQGYEVKFFNLPLCKFGFDQLMVIFYFYVAVLTESPYQKVDPQQLANDTVESLLVVFFLYLVWDGLGIWMATAKEDGRWKYPKIKEGEPDYDDPSRKDGYAAAITFGSLILLVLVYLLLDCKAIGVSTSFVFMAIILIAYRFAKEVKNTLMAST